MKLSAMTLVSRLFSLTAAGVIAFALAACGDEPPPKPAAKAAPPVAQPTPAPEAKAAAPKPADPAPATADSDLAARVKAALLNEPALNAHGIDVTAKEGVVTLFGTSTTRARRDAAAKIAGGVAGVKRVENNLAVVAGS